jgi:hypothetical protein
LIRRVLGWLLDFALMALGALAWLAVLVLFVTGLVNED